MLYQECKDGMEGSPIGITWTNGDREGRIFILRQLVDYYFFCSQLNTAFSYFRKGSHKFLNTQTRTKHKTFKHNGSNKEQFEPRHEISNNVVHVCATSKGSDQPAHTRSLIRAFAGRLNIQ